MQPLPRQQPDARHHPFAKTRREHVHRMHAEEQDEAEDQQGHGLTCKQWESPSIACGNGAAATVAVVYLPSSRATCARRIICWTCGTACIGTSSTSGCALANTRNTSSANAWPMLLTLAKSSTTVLKRSMRCIRRLACERDTRFSSPTLTSRTGTMVFANA